MIIQAWWILPAQATFTLIEQLQSCSSWNMHPVCSIIFISNELRLANNVKFPSSIKLFQREWRNKVAKCITATKFKIDTLNQPDSNVLFFIFFFSLFLFHPRYLPLLTPGILVELRIRHCSFFSEGLAFVVWLTKKVEVVIFVSSGVKVQGETGVQICHFFGLSVDEPSEGCMSLCACSWLPTCYY